MKDKIKMSGQWLGHFMYGPDYGEKLHGEKVTFRLFLEDMGNEQFKGTCFEIGGIGANNNVATINGFIQEEFISFTKTYPIYYGIDENGKSIENDSSSQPRISYEGYYNSISKNFVGNWEIWSHEELVSNGSIVNIGTGNWEMRKDD
jgi:hypothetical protein